MEFTDVEFRGGIGQWRIHEFQLVGLDSLETSNIRNLRSRLNGGEKAEKAEWGSKEEKEREWCSVKEG